MVANIDLGQIEEDKNYQFINKYDEDNDMFVQNLHSCKYYEMDEIKNKFAKADGFSTYSHNIRSINGHFDDILDIVHTAQPLKFSVLAFQEIRSVQKTYNIHVN